MGGPYKARHWLLAVAATGVLLATAPAVAGSAADDCDGGTAEALRCLVNSERRERGLPALRPSKLLARAARNHAADMVRRHYFSHVTPEGAAVDDRMRRAGYLRDARDWGLGEAIGYAGREGRAALRLMRTFMGSAEHRRLLMRAGFDRLGVGVASGYPVAGKPGEGITVVLAVARARRGR